MEAESAVNVSVLMVGGGNPVLRSTFKVCALIAVDMMVDNHMFPACQSNIPLTAIGLDLRLRRS